jgi:hypothetical protein
MKPIAYSFTAIALLLAAVPAAASLPATEETSYGYLRTVEGPGQVVQASSGARIEIEANYPILTGDALEVDPGGRIELSLPDFNVVRLAGGSELLLDRLALSADTEDAETTLRLLRGEMQFLVHDLLPVAERPRVDTANATVYLQGSGVYRIATDGYGWTEVVVRSGFAEIATEAGSSVVRSGEQAWVEGGRWPRIDIERAGAPDELERWGGELDGELTAYGEPPVEDHLAYAAAPLERHGSWVTDDGYRAWRPAVSASWRPYEAGYWADTPGGMVWVSSEPWAWVTYHYGSWVPSASFGWVWRPGFRFSPAWVYWYWGPSYVAWVPVGYYSSHYGHYGRGFRLGIHGWAGGSWSYFADWTFCSTRDYHRRDLRRHVRRGHHLARDTRSRNLERGLISTDSRRDARRQAARGDRSGSPGGDSLPDVTAFVARRNDLPREITERVFSQRRAVPRDDQWERPETGRRTPVESRSSLRARAAVPRAHSRETIEAWRRESGRLRAGDSPAGRSAAPRALPATPGERAAGDRAARDRAARDRSPAARAPGARGPGTRAPGARAPGEGAAEPSRWWQDRSGSTAPRGVPPTAGGSRGARARPGTSAAPSGARPPVVRRVWEGIRDRQRAAPSTAPPTARTPTARTPAARTPARRAPSTQPRQTPSRRPPAAQPRSEPQRGSSTEKSSPPRRQPAARGGSGGSSGKSSARANRGSSNRRSAAGSSRGRSAKRRPPR